MATRIVTSVGSTDPDTVGCSIDYRVSEDFDRAMDLVVPLEQPSSALAAREAMIFNLIEDDENHERRVFIRPETVVLVEEIV